MLLLEAGTLNSQRLTLKSATICISKLQIMAFFSQQSGSFIVSRSVNCNTNMNQFFYFMQYFQSTLQIQGEIIIFLFSSIFRQQKKYYRSPDKSDISSPCGFEHLVSIGSRDYTKFFSLQTFVNKNLPKKVPKVPHYGKTRWAPQPPRREVA